MTLLDFDELPVGSGVSLMTLDRGPLTGSAVVVPAPAAPGPVVQRGSVQLVSGVSPFIPADINPLSCIVATLKTFSGGGGGIINIKATDRVSAPATAGGGFRITSIAAGNGSTSGTDDGAYDWVVVT